MSRRRRFLFTLALLGLSACGRHGEVTLETAWCDQMLESDMMARALRGQTVGDAVATAKAHCVLVPAGTAYTAKQETTNEFGQAYLQAEVVRPDTGKTALMWVREAAAGIK
ncbi:MAG: hypothetical protein GC201_06415 [Alphaproteobacteria bacterium]|nr:hypothetical protein [Alphaproteobacteria bacterium]